MDARRLALRAIPLLLVLSSTAALVAGANQCPKLVDAVRTVADFNNPHLGLDWFLNRGLRKGTRYGCMKPDAGEQAPYHFASGCGCDAHETCHSRALEYSTSFADRQRSAMGECRCCSWWVIFLIVVGCLLLVIGVIQFPRFRKFVVRRWRRYKMERRSSLAALEEGDAREFDGLGSHRALNDSRDDRRASEVRARRSRRDPAASTAPSAPGIRRKSTPVGAGSGKGSPTGLRAPGSDRSPAPVGWSDHDRSSAYVEREALRTGTPTRSSESPPPQSVTPPTAAAMTPRDNALGDMSLGSRPDGFDDDVDTR